MTENLNNGVGRQARLNEAVLQYVEATETGRALSRSQLLAKFPDLRTELKEFFASHDAVERLAAPLRNVSRQNGGESGTDSPSDLRSSYTGDACPTNAAEEVIPPATPSGLGQLGDFQLLREVGRGGMGVVYEAEQISLLRRVAVKILPFAAAIDPRQLQRFQNEAQAAAQLRHEHIIPVFAIGSDRGVHYYAMQYIDGQSLADLIEDLRHSAHRTRESTVAVSQKPGVLELSGSVVSSASQSRSPSLARTRSESVSRETLVERRRYFRWVAGLGRQAALALEHAHQAGIVHRDIKPGNLLLDADGQLWVADFGLARFRVNGQLTLTLHGEMLGTLRYASPEQALGQPGLVDHRSDIYSLGATLYELLTLRPIFNGQNQNELLRQIANDEPAPLRAVDKAIPHELETIILKAIAKEAVDRYATAQDFADDLERFLGDHPIRARRPSLLEKATKWARRHRAVMASALGALLIMTAALAVTTALTVRAYERERQQHTRAEVSFRQARQAVDRFAQIGELEFVGRPDLVPFRRRLLETALDYYQDFLNQSQDYPTSQAELETSRAKAEAILERITTLMGRAARTLPLHLKEVRAELDLSDDQWEALRKIQRSWRKALEESFEQNPEKWETSQLEPSRRFEAAVDSLLKPQQLRRLNQISWQLLGPEAFTEPAVIEGLRLRSTQKDRIRAVQEKARPGVPPFGPPETKPGKRPPSPDDAFFHEAWARREKAVEEILSILTPEQRQKWQELVGKPFVSKVRLFPPPPPLP